MIQRKNYFEQLRELIDKPFIKVITGVRRCGKSSLLLLLKDELLSRSILSEQIITINFESFDYSELTNAESLYVFVKDKIKNKSSKYYLLFDEIQEVVEWEKAINSFLIDFNVDIYITGSNSKLLSSELATYLAGRYVEIPIYTLSFQEYLTFKKVFFPSEIQSIKNEFAHFLRSGGFPVIHTSHYDLDTIYKIIYDIYSSIILRDTVQRYNIREVELLERVIKYIFNNIGNNFSAKNIADYFKSQQRSINLNTIYNYLSALESAFLIYRTQRYDLKGKEILKTQEKYYLSDLSLLYSVMGFRDTMIGGILENIVFLELKRRGFKVYVGKYGVKEIDFIAENRDKKIYVQVAYKLDTDATIKREFNTLLEIKDQYPKYVVTMDEFWKENIGGVRHYFITDFLLKEEY